MPLTINLSHSFFLPPLFLSPFSIFYLSSHSFLHFLFLSLSFSRSHSLMVFYFPAFFPPSLLSRSISLSSFSSLCSSLFLFLTSFTSLARSLSFPFLLFLHIFVIIILSSLFFIPFCLHRTLSLFHVFLSQSFSIYSPFLYFLSIYSVTLSLCSSTPPSVILYPFLYLYF